MVSVRRLAPTLGLALLLAAGAAAEGERWGYDMADELMSPYCPGRALSECPSPQAADLRGWILEQEEAGVSKEAVETELFRVFGDQLRQTPRAEGVGLVAYAIPAVAFVLGGGLVAWFLRRQRAGRAATERRPAPPLAPVDPELERKVDEELGRA
jgi:cytochrome c-type biogenesis protein CcmH/NrfF